MTWRHIRGLSHLPKASVESCYAATNLASYVKNFPGWPTLFLLHWARPIREAAYTGTYILTSLLIKADLVWIGKIYDGMELFLCKRNLSKLLWIQVIFPDSYYVVSSVGYQAKPTKYQGVFEVKIRVKTWQVRGIWSQQLEHKQVPKWGTEPGIRKDKRSLLACHTFSV